MSVPASRGSSRWGGGPPRRGRGRFLPLLGAALLLVPLVEIVVAILVGRAVGVWPTVLLILLGCLLGLVVLRRVGLQAVRGWAARVEQLRQEAAAGRPPGSGLGAGLPTAGDTALLGAAGVLLLVPGLLTDLLGLLLLVPPVRRFVRARIARAVGRAVDRAVITRTGVPGGRTVVTGEAVEVEVVDVREAPPRPPGQDPPALGRPDPQHGPPRP